MLTCYGLTQEELLIAFDLCIHQFKIVTYDFSVCLLSSLQLAHEAFVLSLRVQNLPHHRSLGAIDRVMHVVQIILNQLLVLIHCHS